MLKLMITHNMTLQTVFCFKKPLIYSNEKVTVLNKAASKRHTANKIILHLVNQVLIINCAAEYFYHVALHCFQMSHMQYG